MQRIVVAVLAVLFLSNCAHQGARPDGEVTSGDRVFLPPAQPHEVESFRVSDPQPPQVVDGELQTIPTEENEKVTQWINYFQGRGRPHMERYLARSTRYLKIMQNILRKNGLPEDLIYIALIESGFSPRATSRAAAVGYWQFIRGTGKRYGLEINALVDERRDPILATQAAAEYFKGLYSIFGSWYLAMASYNVGENRVKREVMNHYTRDFWELAKKRRFPKETVNYIPKFIAAKLIANNPAKYGFTEIEYEKPLEFELIKVDKAVNLKQMAAKMNYDYDDLKQMNPKFKGEIAPAKTVDNSSVLELRVPIGQAPAALLAANSSTVDKVEFIADAGETTTHKVRSGESLYTIARKYRTTVAFLRDVNDIKAGRKLRIGMRLQVPERSGRRVAKVVAKSEKIKELPPVATEKATEETELVTKEGKFYLVQPGDNLSTIADDYDSTVNELRKMNKLRRGHVLKVGMRLRVPGDDQGIPVAPDSDKVVPSRGPQALAPIAHIVKPGETLTTIAAKYGVTIEALRKANNLKNKSVLKVGVRLMIPITSSMRQVHHRQTKSALHVAGGRGRNLAKAKTRIHVVKRGENLSHIAGKYQVSVSEILERNRVAKSSKLFVGARLLIPEANARD